MVVTGLLYSRAARDGLGVQVVDHAGLRGQPAIWQLRPRGLGAHSGAPWTCCLCSSFSCLPWLLHLSSPCPDVQHKTQAGGGPEGESLRLRAIRIPSNFSLSHSSKQSPSPSFNTWQHFGHLVNFLSSFVLRQGGWSCTCV